MLKLERVVYIAVCVHLKNDFGLTISILITIYIAIDKYTFYNEIIMGFRMT